MDKLTKKTITTKRGFEYTYYVLAAAAAARPTLLLHHGFPDQAEEWEQLINNHLRPAGYGVIAPDLLGYGGTSKPTDPAAYKFGGMTADLVEILDAEKVDKVVSLGHDWGSRAAQLFFNLHPGRVSGLIMVNVPWMGAKRGPFDLDEELAQSQQHFGYGRYWYWKLFTADDVCLPSASSCNTHCLPWSSVLRGILLSPWLD
jgi:soluble epoxide hydrolase / lipid-phosphate phosphatase